MGLVYSATSALAKFVALNFFQLQVFGRENIVEEGPALLAMNHQSFLDPPFAGICCHREIHYLARKTLFDIPLVGRALRHLNLVGVDRDGTDMSALKNVIRILRGGGCTIVFPEGTRTADGSSSPPAQASASSSPRPSRLSSPSASLERSRPFHARRDCPAARPSPSSSASRCALEKRTSLAIRESSISA